MNLPRIREDAHRAPYGPIPEHAVDYFHQRGATFGATLQVPQEMRPRTATRSRSTGSAFIGRLSLFFTAGFLPQRFRDEMLLSWTRAASAASSA